MSVPIQEFEVFEKETERLLAPPFESKFGAILWRDRRQPRKRLSFIVNGWITENSITFVGGSSGSGKSFLVLHLSMCLARGEDFFEAQVKRCGVIYQAGEGGLGLLDRMEAYNQHYKVPEDEAIPFALLPTKINIFAKESRDVENMIAEVRALKVKMDVESAVVVIDTLRKATGGADEISGKDNAVIVDNLDRIRSECGVSVIVVHHTNADGKKLRGHTSLRDDVDQVIMITNDKETGIRTALLDKMKDGEDGREMKFSLASIPVRQTEDGEVVTSCAVMSVSEKQRLKKEQERQGIWVSPTERKILMNIFAAVDRHGIFVVDEKEYPKAAMGKTIVRYETYRDISLERMPEEADRKKATDQIYKEFQRAKNDMIRKGIIGLTSPYMWWDGKPVRGFARTFPRKSNVETDDEPSPAMRELYDEMGSLF